MFHFRAIGALVLFGLTMGVAGSADQPARRTPKEALRAFNHWIGSWRATGIPEGTREQKQKGFWTETMSWEWRFKGNDAWLKVNFDKGKYFRTGELHYLPEKDGYQLILRSTDKETLVFGGVLKGKQLLLERDDEKKEQTQRLVFNLLHSNRFTYRYEVKPKDRPLFSRVWQVGATKEGESFATGDSRPECVVSGGLGTLAVTYKGKTYYVCCTGCRDAFKDEPEKYLKEYEERKAKEAKEKKR